LTNLDLLPATGSVVIAAPLKIKQGSGSPLRVLALVPMPAIAFSPQKTRQRKKSTAPTRAANRTTKARKGRAGKKRR
jgi:hypothetical protein